MKKLLQWSKDYSWCVYLPLSLNVFCDINIDSFKWWAIVIPLDILIGLSKRTTIKRG